MMMKSQVGCGWIQELLVVDYIVGLASSHTVVQWIIVGKIVLVVVVLCVLGQVGFV